MDADRLNVHREGPVHRHHFRSLFAKDAGADAGAGARPARAWHLLDGAGPLADAHRVRFSPAARQERHRRLLGSAARTARAAWRRSMSSRSGRRVSIPRAYDVALYQIGNNPYHAFAYEMALEHPGVVVLHEANLHHLIADLTIRRGDWDAYLREVRVQRRRRGAGLCEAVRATLEARSRLRGRADAAPRCWSARAASSSTATASAEAVRAAGFTGPIAAHPARRLDSGRRPQRLARTAGPRRTDSADRHLRVSEAVQTRSPNPCARSGGWCAWSRAPA